MGVLTEGGRHVGLDAIAADAVWLSLHDGDPSTSGANEISGGSPAYARKQATWSAASGGERVLASDVTFDVPAGTTVAHVGLWDAETNGNFRGSHDVTDEVFAAQGNFVVEQTTTLLSVKDT